VGFWGCEAVVVTHGSLNGGRRSPLRKLILVKHSLPQIVPALPSDRWLLSEEGRRRAGLLAERIRPLRPGVVVSSREPKARETADVIAGSAGLTVVVREGLHEHERSGVGFLGALEFDEAIRSMFARPAELVLGDETAVEAGRRFASAVEAVLDRYRDGDVVVVAHGTVIALFVSGANDVAPFQFWSKLGLPSYVVLSAPGMGLLETVGSIE
jgi:broad specificity phosphatase PhoE